jgi:hypothetical protein
LVGQEQPPPVEIIAGTDAGAAEPDEIQRPAESNRQNQAVDSEPREPASQDEELPTVESVSVDNDDTSKDDESISHENTTDKNAASQSDPWTDTNSEVHSLEGISGLAIQEVAQDDASTTDEEDQATPAEAGSRRARRHRGIPCISCSTNTRKSNTLQFPCEHTCCHNCVADLHRAATTDESLFPPRCCGQEVPFDLVRPILSEDEGERFGAKAVEFRTKDKTYCFKPACSKFIPPQEIEGNVARCGDCRSKTCALCKQALHDGACPEDEETAKVVELAEAMGWQGCKSCKRVIELNHGCNHISKFKFNHLLASTQHRANPLLACTCHAEFCYRCGLT